MNLADRLRMLREQANLTQLELAKVLNISNSALSQYESGGRVPSDTVKIAMADYFNVSLDYLMGRQDQNELTPISESESFYPSEYNLLSPANKAIVDRLIAALAQSQSPAPAPTKLYIAASDGSRQEVVVDSDITLPEKDTLLLKPK